MISSIKEYFSKSDETEQIGQTEKDSNKGIEKKAPSGDALAQVGSWSITKQEFEEKLKALKQAVPEYDIEDPEVRSLVLEELIRQQLLINEAEKAGFSEQKDIKAAMEEFRRTLIVREYVNKLTKDVTVSDSEARLFYNEKKDLLIEPVEWYVSEIVVATELEATEIKAELLKGSDFAAIAIDKSISQSASNGGDLGILKEEPFPKMAEAILSLDEGQVSSVFKGPEGHYIVKLNEKKGGESIAYEDIKEDIIKNQTALKQQQEVLNFIEKLRNQAKVKINEELLK